MNRIIPLMLVFSLVVLTAVPMGALAAETPANETEGNATTSGDETAANETTVWDSVIFEHGPGVELNGVEKRGDRAVVYKTASKSAADTDVVLTDVTRTTSGEMPRDKFTLSEGHNTFSIEMVQPYRCAVTVDAAGSIFLQKCDDRLEWPSIWHFGAFGVGLLSAFLLLVGLSLRDSRKQENRVKEV